MADASTASAAVAAAVSSNNSSGNSSSKRQSMMAGKVTVATPNVASPGLVTLDAALMSAVGGRVRINTTQSSTPIEGTLHALSPALNILTLALPGTTPQHTTYHILPLASLTGYTTLSTAPINTPAAALPPAPSPSALAARLTTALATARAADARKGKGVTAEAQALFDALARTLPARWQGTDMVISDAVVVASPYRGDDCRLVTGGGGTSLTLARLKVVVEKEKRKLAEKGVASGRENRPAVPAVPLGGMRKGG